MSIRDLQSLIAEFVPDRQQMERQVREELARRHAAGEEVREGEIAKALMLAWTNTLGESLASILLRRGLVRLDEDVEQ